MGRGWFLYNSLCVHQRDSLTRFWRAANDFHEYNMGPWCSVRCLIFFSLSYNIISSKFSVRPGTVLFPGAYYSPGIRFKTTAAILAVGQRLLSFNTYCGNQLLWSGNFPWLLHLPGTAPTDWGSSVSLCYKQNLTFK